MRKYNSCAMAAMLAITATLSAVKTSTAGIFPVDTVTLKAAAPHDVVDVHHDGGAIFAGVALGLLGAAIVGNSYYYGPVTTIRPTTPATPIRPIRITIPLTQDIGDIGIRCIHVIATMVIGNAREPHHSEPGGE